MQALLFGSIGTIVETSELQHRAFNLAFDIHELDWHWDRESYEEMLKVSGGVRRIMAYAARQNTVVDAQAVHATKTGIFLDLLRNGQTDIRPGVVDLLKRAKADGCKTGFVSGTEQATIDIIIALLRDAGVPDFDVVTSRALNVAEKPDPALYVAALSHLGIAAGQALAIEDNVDGVAAAKAAGLSVIGSPGTYTQASDLGNADVVTDDLYASVAERLGTMAGFEA